MLAIRKTSRSKRWWEPYLFILPAVTLFSVFSYFPFFRTIWMSFHLVSSSAVTGKFVGLQNYELVLQDPNFTAAIVTTLMYVAIAVPCSIIIAFTLALMANKRRSTSKIYETMYALPMAMSMSVTVLIFQFMLNPGLGIINHWLGVRIDWFVDKQYLLVVMIVICVWLNIGFDFLYLLAAVRNVPRDLIECADLEGANSLQKTIRIIIPIVSPTLFFLLCTEVTKAMMMSAPLIIINAAYATTSNIKTIMYYMYVQAFQNYNYSFAFSSATIGFLLTFSVILSSFLLEKKGVHYS